MVEMELREIQINEESPGHQIIIIGEKYGNRSFPIYIGSHEAIAMDLAVRKIAPPRPLTHDLIVNILTGLGLKLERVLIDDLRLDTFHGKLVILDSNGEEIFIDSRPSDAIVLASRMGCPIYVADRVLDEVSREYEEEEGPEEGTEEEEQ